MNNQLRKIEMLHNETTHNQTTQNKTLTQEQMVNLETIKRIMNRENTT